MFIFLYCLIVLHWARKATTTIGLALLG